MNSEKAGQPEAGFYRVLTAVALLAALAGLASVAHATYTLPADRSVTWLGNVGVSGDIPARTKIYRTLSASGLDDSKAIQGALDSCPPGQVVLLREGTFHVGSAVTVRSHTTLRGAGMGKTVIKGMPGMTGAYVAGIRGSYATGPSLAISGGLSKGSSSISTSAPHGWSAGDIILIDQLNDPSGDPVVTSIGYDGTCTWCGRAGGTRSLGQMVEVVSVPSATSATLEIPLYWNYSSSLSPQATKYSDLTVNAGMEDFTVDNSLSGGANQDGDGGTLMLRGAANSWILRVEAIGSYKSMVKVHDAYRNTVRGGKYHEGVPALPSTGTQYGAGRAYGFFINPAASANLFENNELYHLVDMFMINGAVSGNVFGYNYATEPYAAASDWQLSVFDMHGGHPMMNLFEGNYSDARISTSDNVWGSSSHNTFFRNRNTLTPGKTRAPWNNDLQKNATYYSFVGNVFGTLGVENVYDQEKVALIGLKAIYRFGYTSDGDDGPSGNDPKVSATVLRHANWDSYHGRTVYHGSDDRVLPASLYLTGRPAWWGGRTAWPAVGPDLSPMYPTARGAGKGTPWGSSSTPTDSPPTAHKVL